MMLHRRYLCFIIEIWQLRTFVAGATLTKKPSCIVFVIVVSLALFGTSLVSQVLIFLLLPARMIGSEMELNALDLPSSSLFYGGSGDTGI
jgi:hypothetical protein